MLVVDASCLYEFLIGNPEASAIRRRLDAEPDHAAPHVVDVEVLGAVRRNHLLGNLDRTEATQAIEGLQTWPGERFSHVLLLRRAWQLRDNVRGWDAMYVALAEALDAVLVTSDRRLAAATGPTCRIEAIGGG
jgi:predicted nucleic acid-binding protein